MGLKKRFVSYKRQSVRSAVPLLLPLLAPLGHLRKFLLMPDKITVVYRLFLLLRSEQLLLGDFASAGHLVFHQATSLCHGGCDVTRPNQHGSVFVDAHYTWMSL